MIQTVVILLLLFLLGTGFPVAFAMLVAGSFGLYMIGGIPFLSGYLETTPLSVALSYELVTVPMFLLMAELVILSGIANSLFRAIAMWFGRVPGGLGIATAFAGAAFGAISGSSTAAAATLSATSVPAMAEHNYEMRMATGIVAISGTLAMLIPPSIILIIYGFVSGVSIGKLLVAGVIPGILAALTIAGTILLLVYLKPERAPRGERYSWGERFNSMKVAGPFMLLFMTVTGVIYLGVATPTEASALGAAGALLLTIVSRRFTFAGLALAVGKATRTTCMIIMIISGAHVFGYFFTMTQTSQDIIHLVGSLDVPRYVAMLMILSFYLVLGCFFDQLTIIILTVPVVLPLVVLLGYDPIWFGVIVVLTAEVGMVTPPLGLNVFVVAKYSGIPPGEVFAGTAPHVVAHLLLILVLLAFPDLVLWAPSMMSN
jgi:C4-dicarboxylate transporter, DctM subunit